jgi:hypothetical protein
MARRKQRVFPVSTVPIKRAILRAAKKLKRMEKKKLLPPKRKAAIRLELALLKDCFYKLGNISGF